MAAGSEFVLEVAGGHLNSMAPDTGSWDKFQPIDIGRIEIKQPGDYAITLHPRAPTAWKAINLRSITFTPVK